MKKILFVIGGGGILFTLGGGLLTGLRLQKLAEREAGPNASPGRTKQLELAGAIRA